MERKGQREDRLRATQAADQRREGRTDAAVHLETRKKVTQTREGKKPKDKGKDLSGSEHSALPSALFDHLLAFLVVPLFASSRILVSSRSFLFSTTPSATHIEFTWPRSPCFARFSTASRRVLYEDFIIQSIARDSIIYSILFS